MKSLIFVAAYSSVTLVSGRVIQIIIASGAAMCQIWTSPGNATAGLICLNEGFGRASYCKTGCESRLLVLLFLCSGASLPTGKGK